METISAESWRDFFVAVVGAASALAGLVFVALSLNLERIRAMPGMSARAGETMILLAAALILSLLVLIPQTTAALGVEVGLTSLVAWGVPALFQLRAGRERQYDRRWQFLVRVVLHQAATIPLLLSATALIWNHGAAYHLLATGVLFVMIFALNNAWILLVEIVAVPNPVRHSPSLRESRSPHP